MKRFILRWRDDNGAAIKSATVKVDNVDAGFFRLHIYRTTVDGSVRRTTRNYGTAHLTWDIMGEPPKGFAWFHADNDKTNFCRENLVARPKNLAANVAKRKTK